MEPLASEGWLQILEGCPKAEDLAETVRLWRKLRELVRSRTPTEENRIETVELCERMGVELNRRFPTTGWNSYLFELVWNLSLFAHDQVPIASKSEDKFEAAIWLFKHMPTNSGGGNKSDDPENPHKEDPEYQILARLFNTSHPGAMTQRACIRCKNAADAKHEGTTFEPAPKEYVNRIFNSALRMVALS